MSTIIKTSAQYSCQLYTGSNLTKSTDEKMSLVSANSHKNAS